jgi:hypothetical protein
MLFNQGQSATPTILLNPASAANTAAATSAWVDVRGFVGDLVITHQVGAITGTLTATIEDATDGAGSGGAAIALNEGAFAVVSVANKIERRTLNADATRGFIRYVGTIATGPALVAVGILSRPSAL